MSTQPPPYEAVPFPGDGGIAAKTILLPVRPLPCPFCLQEPITFHRFQSEPGGDYRYANGVECSSPPDRCVKPKVTRMGPFGYRQKDDPPSDEAALAAALKLWNTRAREPRATRNRRAGRGGEG